MRKSYIKVENKKIQWEHKHKQNCEIVVQQFSKPFGVYMKRNIHHNPHQLRSKFLHFRNQRHDCVGKIAQVRIQSG